MRSTIRRQDLEAAGGIGSLDDRDGPFHEVVPLEAIDEAHFDAMFGLNVKGMVFAVQKALPLMSDGSTIVLNGSIAGSKGIPGQSLYNASKAAVRSFARSWTTDLKV